MERNPFVRDPAGAPEKERHGQGERNHDWREIARQQAEIDRRRGELNRQLSQLASERLDLEGRAEREWRRLDERTRRAHGEKHRVLGNQLRAVLEEKEELREDESQLDQRAASLRDAERRVQRSQDGMQEKEASESLETRLTEREDRRQRMAQLRRDVQGGRNALHDADYLREHATEAFSRERDDERDIEL